MDLRKRNVHGLPFSNADYIDLKNGTRGQFSDMAGVFSFPILAQRADGTPEQIVLAQVTTNFFGLMGAKILYGRDFNQSDGIPQAPQPQPGQAGAAGAAAPPPLPQMAILSYEYFRAPVWRRSGCHRAHAGERGRRTAVGGGGSFGAGVPAVFSSRGQPGGRAGFVDRESARLRCREPQRLWHSRRWRG